VGAQAIKYVLVRRKGPKVQVEDFGLYPIPEGQSEQQEVGHLLTELSKRIRLKGVRTVLASSGLTLAIRRGQLPKLKKKELWEAASWLVKKDLSMEGADYLIDYAVLGTVERKGVTFLDVVTVASEKAAIEAIVEDFPQAPFRLWKISPQVLSLGCLFQRGLLEEGAPSCIGIVDIGARKTAITFFRGGRYEFSREIPTAGQDMTQALASTVFLEGKSVSLSVEQAEEVKRRYGVPPDDQLKEWVYGVPLLELAVLMRPVLERLTREIQRSIDYYRQNYEVAEIDRLYLVGGTASLKNLVAYLNRHLDIPVECLALHQMAGIEIGPDRHSEFEAQFSLLAPALALALDWAKGPNLLPESYKRWEKALFQRRLLGYGASFVVFTLAMSSLLLLSSSSGLENRLHRVKAEYQKLVPKMTRYRQLAERKKTLKRKKALYEEKIVLDQTAVEVLKMLSSLIPERISLTSVWIGEGNAPGGALPPHSGISLRIKGVIDRPRPYEDFYLADFMLRLQKTGVFSQLSLREQRLSPDRKRLHFEIVGRIF